MVRIIHMAADGRALAGDADLDGAPVCSYVWVLARSTAYLRGRVIPSRGRRGVIFFGTGCARLRYLGAPARGSLHGCYLGHGVGARALAVPARVKQCLALWKANWCARLRRAHVDLLLGQIRIREAANRLPQARLLHVTHAIYESLPLLCSQSVSQVFRPPSSLLICPARARS